MIPEDVHNLCTEQIWPLAKAASRLFELVTASTSLLFFFPTLPPWEKVCGVGLGWHHRLIQRWFDLDMLGDQPNQIWSFCIRRICVPRVLNWIVTHMFGEWLYCFEVLATAGCVSAMIKCNDKILNWCSSLCWVPGIYLVPYWSGNLS